VGDQQRELFQILAIDLQLMSEIVEIWFKESREDRGRVHRRDVDIARSMSKI
jgi:hypothetical protein